MLSELMSAAYIQLHFKIVFIMEAKAMNPGQNAPMGADVSESTVFEMFAVDEKFVTGK